jgi:hypothetical protein
MKCTEDWYIKHKVQKKESDLTDTILENGGQA